MWEAYLPPRAMVTYGLMLLLKTTSGSVALQQSESMMFMAHDVTKGHRDAQVLSHHLWPWWELRNVQSLGSWWSGWPALRPVTGVSPGPMQLPGTTTGSLVLPPPTWLCSDVHDSHCPQRPQESPTSGPSPVSMLESEGHVTAGITPTSVACICTCDHGIVLPELLLKVMSGTVAHDPTIVRVCINVRGSGYYQTQCRCPSLDPGIGKLAYPPHRRAGSALGKADSTPHLRGLLPAGQSYQLGCSPGTHPGIPQHLPDLWLVGVFEGTAPVEP